jgi:hypothetical protein
LPRKKNTGNTCVASSVVSSPANTISVTSVCVQNKWEIVKAEGVNGVAEIERDCPGMSGQDVGLSEEAKVVNLEVAS